jgi:hypothetical protein
MARMRTVLSTLLLLLVFTSVCFAERMSPALPNEYGRHPHQAWDTLVQRGRAEVVARDIANTYGWTYEYTWNILANRLYDVQAWSGWWHSTGFTHVGGDMYAVGSIYRRTHETQSGVPELFGFWEGKILFSGDCANGRRKPDAPRTMCRKVGEEQSTNLLSIPDVATEFVYIGEDILQGSGDGILIECNFE